MTTIEKATDWQLAEVSIRNAARKAFCEDQPRGRQTGAWSSEWTQFLIWQNMMREKISKLSVEENKQRCSGGIGRNRKELLTDINENIRVLEENITLFLIMK